MVLLMSDEITLTELGNHWISRNWFKQRYWMFAQRQACAPALERTIAILLPNGQEFRITVSALVGDFARIPSGDSAQGNATLRHRKEEHMKARNFTLAITVSVVTAMTIPTDLVAQNQIRYTVTDLGTLGGTFSQAFGMNNNGWVVGFSTLPGDIALHAFVWRKGVMTDLGTLGGPLSAASSVNDAGQVVGYSETSTPDPNGEDFCGFGDHLVCLPVLWQSGVITALPTLGGNNGVGNNINNRGQVVGATEITERDPTCIPPQVLVFKPTIWEEGQPSALPTAPFPDGGTGPAGSDDKGQVVGNVGNCTLSSSAALIWEKNQGTDMGLFQGTVLAPVSINNQGQATGTYTTTVDRGFLWQDGVTIDLGELPGFPTVHGNSINDKGQIAGQTCSPVTCTAFLWRDGVMTDLNTVVSVGSLYMFDPASINSSGEIVGLGIDFAAGQAHAFLAIPCDGTHANQKSCTGKSATAAPAEPSQGLNVALPENVRRLLNGRVGVRFHIPSAF